MRTITITDSGAVSSFDVHSFGAGSPHLFITAGIHGDEYGGIYAAERLLEYFSQNPPQRGTVSIIPRCNPTASRCMQRRSPFDGEDMNRIFPGSQSGSLTHKIAAALWNETAAADYIIDLHCCGQHGTPYVLCTYEEDASAKALAKLITLDVVIRSEGTPGQLFTESGRQRGQAAVIIEIPSGTSKGSIHPIFADAAYDAVLDALRSLGFLAGEPQGSQPGFYGPLEDADASAAGLWEPCAVKGHVAQKGYVLGHIGGTPVAMPEEGYIMAVRPKGYIFADGLWTAIYAPTGRSIG